MYLRTDVVGGGRASYFRMSGDCGEQILSALSQRLGHLR